MNPNVEPVEPLKFPKERPMGFKEFCVLFLGCALVGTVVMGMFSATIDAYFGKEPSLPEQPMADIVEQPTTHVASAATPRTFDISVPVERANSYGDAKVVVIVDRKTGVEYIVYREKLLDQVSTSITPRLNPDGTPRISDTVEVP